MNHATPILSILIASVPTRLRQLEELFAKLSDQIAAISPPPLVEILAFTDNKFRTVGDKRQALVDISTGTHVVFIDDDDDIADTYIAEIVAALRSDPDVVTFEQLATLIGKGVAIVSFDLRHEVDEVWQPSKTIKRRPWHKCPWRRTLATQCIFPAKNYREDVDWADQINLLARTQIHIPKILYFYVHDPTLTEAPNPKK
jgi:glycosyltransferase involved in cell wall biosynthesis